MAVLAAIALQSYQAQIRKGNRAAAQSYMMDLAQREAQYLLDARAYASTETTLGYAATPADVAPHYTISIAAPVVAPPARVADPDDPAAAVPPAATLDGPPVAATVVAVAACWSRVAPPATSPVLCSAGPCTVVVVLDPGVSHSRTNWMARMARNGAYRCSIRPEADNTAPSGPPGSTG